MKAWAQKQPGFTIVELLIVVVIIAILAAITIVSYNGISNRAKESSAATYLSQNAKLITNAANSAAQGTFAAATLMTSGLADIKPDNSKYRVVTYCANANEYTLLVETIGGKKYYTKNGTTMVNNDTLDSFQPCLSTGIGSATTTYLNLPAIAAGETTQFTINGTATVVYGSAAQGRFNRLNNQTGTLTCNNATFGDAAPGATKACYVYPN